MIHDTYSENIIINYIAQVMEGSVVHRLNKLFCDVFIYVLPLYAMLHY